MGSPYGIAGPYGAAAPGSVELCSVVVQRYSGGAGDAQRGKVENPKSHIHSGFVPVSLSWANVGVASEPLAGRKLDTWTSLPLLYLKLC